LQNRQSWAPRTSPHVHSSHTRPRVLCYTSLVANKLRRYYGAGYLDFITTSCYRRLQLLEKLPSGAEARSIVDD
jgi:hypothetical protein